MKISYSCLIVAVVIGLGTVTAAPADVVKAVAADAAKLADYENDTKMARLVREAAEQRSEPECREGDKKMDDCCSWQCSSLCHCPLHWRCNTRRTSHCSPKAVAADAAKLADHKNDAKSARLVREAAEQRSEPICREYDEKMGDCCIWLCSRMCQCPLHWRCITPPRTSHCSVKAVAADAAKLADHENDAKSARLVREAADEGPQMDVLCVPDFCAQCRKCDKECTMGRPRATGSLQEYCEKFCGNCDACKDYC